MKKIIIVIVSIVLLIIGYYQVAVFDMEVKSRKTCDLFIQYINTNNYESSYDFLDKFLKKKYSLEEFTSILNTMKLENPCYVHQCSNVTSSDNFNLKINSCDINKLVMHISFGGGWGFGWKVTNIEI